MNVLKFTKFMNIIFFVCFANCFNSSSSGILEKKFTYVTSDVIFPDDVIDVRSSRSKTDCSVQCVENSHCVSFTFHSVIGTCYLRSSREYTNGVSEIGYETYESEEEQIFVNIAEAPIDIAIIEEPLIEMTLIEDDSMVFQVLHQPDDDIVETAEFNPIMITSGAPTSFTSTGECDEIYFLDMFDLDTKC